MSRAALVTASAVADVVREQGSRRLGPALKAHSAQRVSGGDMARPMAYLGLNPARDMLHRA